MRLPQCPECVRKGDGMTDGWNCLGKQSCLIQSLHQDEGPATPRSALPWRSTVNSSKSKQGSLLSILPTGCTPTSAALQEADTQPPAASQGRAVGKCHFSSMSSVWTSAGCSTLPQDSISEEPWDSEGALEESRQVCAWLWDWFLGNVGPPACRCDRSWEE